MKRNLKKYTLIQSWHLLLFLFLLSLSNLQARPVWELISNGAGCNTFFVPEDALPWLNEAISKDPLAKEAYKERAFSFFELGSIDLALKEYEKALGNNSLYKIRNCQNTVFRGGSRFLNDPSSLDFVTGLIQGTLIGAKEETEDFAYSIRGGLSFLWAFVCAPGDVSKEIIESVYAIGEFIAYASIYELLQVALPELMECREYWDSWTEVMKGKKIGYIIGKYGISAFYCITVIRGVSLYSQLRRANMMQILECCSLKKGARILEESSRYASRSSRVLKKPFKYSVVPHNPNVAPHVLLKKHNWEKILPLTGKSDKDFKMVVRFLEEIEILRAKPTTKFSTEIIQTLVYEKDFGNYMIVAEFDMKKLSLPFLKDAWVKPKVPYINKK